MPLLLVSQELWKSYPANKWLKDAFSSVTTAADFPRHLVLQVEHEELPAGNYFINPTFLHFEGIQPFVIDFGVLQ